VISDRLWAARFARSRDAIGRRLTVNMTDFTIIGVAPASFRGTARMGEIDLWVPGSAYPLLRHTPEFRIDDRDMSAFMQLVGRLRPGATLAVAQAQLTLGLARLVEAYPEPNAIYAQYAPVAHPGIGTPVNGRSRMTTMMALMMGVAGLVLVIACANVANLLVVRALNRQGEFAVRRALGASTGRIVRQHIVDGVLLATGGGVAAFGIAWLLGRLLAVPFGSGLRPDGPTVDSRVLGFAIVLSLIVGIAAGLIPAIFAARHDFLGRLSAASRTHTPGGARVRAGLTIVQIAASMALLVAALLFARTVHELGRVVLGFDPKGVTLVHLNFEPQGYGEARGRLLRRELDGRLSMVPGVESSALASHAPLGRTYQGFDLRLPDDVSKTWAVSGEGFFVTSNYFGTLRIPLLTGRTFTDAEAHAPADIPGPIILSQSVARKLFGSDDPLGRVVMERRYEGPVRHTVVGVVADTRSTGLLSEPTLAVYRPLAGSRATRTVLAFTRSSLPHAEMERQVRQVVMELDPRLPLTRVASLSANVADAAADQRLLGVFVGILGGLAGLLATVGLYSVVAYWVAQRRREIGVRMALGAHTTLIVRMVGRQAGVLIAAGLGIGLLAAFVLTRTIESQLYGVTALDPIAYLGATAVLIVLGICAGVVPARAATRVDPVEALKTE
jgi:putative ABC transport system permease protein